MRGLSARHDLSLLSFAAPNDTQLEATRAYCRQLITVQRDVLTPVPLSKRLLQLRSLVSRHSFESLLYRDGRFQKQLVRLVRDNAFDIVQVEFAQMGVYRLPRRGRQSPQYMLDEHNIEYDIVKRTAEAEGGVVRKAYSTVNWRKVRAEELDAWRRFDGVALTSTRDEELLKKDAPRTRTVIVPNAVDLEAFHPTNTPVDPTMLLFFGAMDYHPNVDGVQYFLNQILPGIRAHRPDVRLVVVGRNPPTSLLASRNDCVQFVGYVNDPRTYLDRAAVVVVPLRIGGGTRFKIVEAMAKGKPIVSTSIGAEGLETVHENHLLLANEPAAFIAETCRLLNDAQLSARLGASCRQFAESRFGWETAVGKLEGFYELLLGHNTAPPNS